MGSSLFKGQIDPVTAKKVPEIIVENNSDKTAEALQGSNFYFEKFMENLDSNIEKAYGEGAGTIGVYHDGKKGWCNWAYFEDIVLNTFFAFTTEGENLPQPDGTKDYGNPNTKLMTSVRSMGITFNMDKKGNKEPEVITGPTTCRSGKNLFTISKHIILPGKTAGIIPTQGKEGLKNSGIGALMNKKFEGSETLKDYTDFFHTLQAIKDDTERIPRFELTAEEMKTVNDPDTDKDESLTPSVEGK